MKSFSLPLIVLCARYVASKRIHGLESMSLDADDGPASTTMSAQEEPSSPSASLTFTDEVLTSPECAAAGKADAEGYLLFTENKDTDARNFNSMDVGYVPARLPGPVRIEFTAELGFLEIVDLARGITITSWTDDNDVDADMDYLGSTISLSPSTPDGAKVVTIEPSVPTTLLLRVVIHASKSARRQMKEDGAPWRLNVAWAASPAQSGCGKSSASGVRVPLAQLAKMHTSEYMPFMPGFLAVLRRGSTVNLQVPKPSLDALELLRFKASQTCARLPKVLCHPDSYVSVEVLAQMGFACDYQEHSSSCEALEDYHGPMVELEGSSMGQKLWSVRLEVRKSEGSRKSAEEVCNQWNIADDQREALLRKRLGHVPEDWKQKSELVCTKYLGELALSSSGGAKSCAWQQSMCVVTAVGQSILERTVVLPATLPVGRAALLVNGQFAGAVAIICNPWSSEDPTFLTVDGLRNSTYDPAAQQRLSWSLKDYVDDEARRDYVMKTDGLIFKGAASNGLKHIYGDPWDFHQFRSLYYVLPLLDQLPAPVRANVVLLARKIPGLINSHVLEGNWGEIKDGEQPGFWTSGAEILSRAYRMGPIEKALGIPARVVTNFASAHDTQPYDWFIRKADGDSVWNFHVWNEAWFSREDLHGSDKLAQWNVLDATPQELSEGEMQMGPASLRVVRRGADDLGPLAGVYNGVNMNAQSNWDVAFAIGEVNSVSPLKTSEDNDDLVKKVWAEAGMQDADKIKCEWACQVLDRVQASLADKIKVACPASCKALEDELLDFDTVGRHMSAEAPRCHQHERLQLDIMGHDPCREDLTANYKASKCPTQKFCDMMKEQEEKVKGLNTGSRTTLTWGPKLAQVGDTIEFNLWQEVATPRWVQIRVEALTCKGKTLGVIAQHSGFWEDENLKLPVTPQEYFGMLGRTRFMRVVAVTWPQLEGEIEVKQSSFYANEIVTLLPSRPELRLLKVGDAPDYKLTEEVQWFLGDTVTIAVKWKNPFPFALPGCAVGTMTSETQYHPQPLRTLSAREHIDIAMEQDMELTDLGEQQVSVVVLCRGLEPVVERFSFTVEEKISTADQELSNVFAVEPTDTTVITTPSDTTTVITTTPEPAPLTTTPIVKEPLAEKEKCRVGAHVPCCPDGKCSVRCAGDQCCPGRPLGIKGSFTCPSASRPNAHCTHPKLTDCTGA